MVTFYCEATSPAHNPRLDSSLAQPIEGLKGSCFQATFQLELPMESKVMNIASQRRLSLTLLGVYVLLLLGACFWPFNFFQRNQVDWQASGGLRFVGPGIAYTSTNAAELATLRAFTLVMNLAVDFPGQASWIFSYGLDFDETNLLIGTYARQLVIEIHRGGKRNRANLQGVLEAGKSVWLAIAANDSSMSITLDGELKRFSKSNLPADSRWRSEYPLVVGARSDGKYPMTGVVSQIAIFDRAYDVKDLRHPDLIVKNGRPLVNYDFRNSTGTAVANRGVSDVGPLVIPETFTPFRNPVLMDLKDLWNPLPVWGDIVLNIVAFLPIGLLVAAAAGPSVRLSKTTAIAVVLSFMLSMSIELLQSFLPRRWSTFMDVATNTFGGFLGVTLWISGMVESSWQRLNRLLLFGSPVSARREQISDSEQ
jgi:hypothetical protein